MTIQGRFRVVTERTTVFMPEVAVGLCPDGGTTYVFPRLQNQLGMFLALTGYRLKGADVYHSGMATHYVGSSINAVVYIRYLLGKLSSLGRIRGSASLAPFSNKQKR